MSGRQPHVLVLGLGITGSSIAATLAAGGVRVTAFEQFAPLHDRGSSHGDSRIYRRVPREGAVYVELATSSWHGWQEWSRQAGEKLLVDCGGIDAGPPGSVTVDASEKLCRAYEQPFEMLTGTALNRRHSHYNLPPAWTAIYQPQSGFVRPDATRTFLHRMARSAGARLVHETRVTAIDATATGVTVRTARETVNGDVLVVAAGSWMSRVLPELDLSLSTERRVLAWYRAERGEPLTDGRLPIFCLDTDSGWYGMPTLDGTLKVGHDKHFNEVIDPDQPPIEPGDADAAKLTSCIDRYFRGFDAQPCAMKSCIYTLTPDHHFIIDRHPAHHNIILFSCCSGHGFKYAPAYGSIALDLVSGKPRPDLAVLGLNRTGESSTRYSR